MELRNADTNVRLFTADDVTFGHGVTLKETIRLAKRLIAKVLGDEPDLEVLYGTFSNGASTGVRRTPTGVATKFKCGADITPSCANRFQMILETCETWQSVRESFDFRLVKGGTLFTVPKNSEIDRCAIKEPELNMFCQKGIGDFIRKRMRQRCRIDLNDQSVNQELARIGSAHGHLATLDMSSASDLISQELVFQLLPMSWYDLLNDCRSQVVEVDGVDQELYMFSSMGNGFTFELESLIFWALSRSVASQLGVAGSISVYGDDIIVPVGVAPLLVRVFQYLGFKVNAKKSFWKGPFRESCGKHWYAGVDVTPFYIREPISHVARAIHFLNRLRAWGLNPKTGYVSDWLHPFWKKWSSVVPTSVWGGKDLSRIDALVTRHAPRKRLVLSRKEVFPPSDGAYLQWLRTADGRESIGDVPLVTSVIKVETNRWVLRRNADNRDEKIGEFLFETLELEA